MRRCLFPYVLLVVGWSMSDLSQVSLGQDARQPSRSAPQSARTTDSSEEVDPYLWLEDVLGDKALDWVRARNSVAQKKLESPEFTQLRDDLLAILDSDARIPAVTKRGNFYYNFWRDKKNERGLWRRTSWEEYAKPNPQWDVILDLDKLAAEEHENWVWRSVYFLRPDYTRCLINLSRGGADATVTREFDLENRAFVKDGFYRPEAKGDVSWIDREHIFIFSDFGPGTLTESGYPRLAKLWTRGTPLSEAKIVYEGQPKDMYIQAQHDDSPGFERNFVSRTLAFYNDELYLLTADGALKKVDAPNTANKSVFHEYLAIELREPWTVSDKTFPAGALLVTNFDDFMAGQRRLDVVFEPTQNTALASHGFTRDYLYLNVLDDVKNRIHVLKRTDAGWVGEPLQGAPRLGTINIEPVDADESNDYFLTTTDYLTPTTLARGQIGHDPEAIKSLPAFFDAGGLTISQRFAVSKDGTKIPYYMVARSELRLDGNNPTLLYGYGGFEISLLPNYNAGVGRAWTTQGGVYVVANIRGGGEYGPSWHQSALKANRLRAYEDFAAVAEDLIARKVTSPRRLGIQGGSNGGLLVGNMFTQYPQLFQAAVCQVPLLDMKRYNHLLAGASWMAEYGNPDLPEEWDFIRTYSPYQNVRAQVKYPAVLFTTSTRDDRVHPGHARKMMARMEEQGHSVLYYENIEGGHGGAANNRQAAYMQALAYTFLRQQLFPQ